MTSSTGQFAFMTSDDISAADWSVCSQRNSNIEISSM